MTTFTHLFLGDGRVTLAVREEADHQVSVGIAWCSPKDQFSRAMGREIALMPLDHPDKSTGLFAFSFTSTVKGKSVIRLKDEAVATFLHLCHTSKVSIPSWAKKHGNYKYLYNSSGKSYTMSYEGDSITVSESSRAVFTF